MLAASAGVALFVSPPASAKETLYPPLPTVLYHNPYGMQVAVNGWVSSFTGLGGYGPNSFTCQYNVMMAIPVDGDRSLMLPPSVQSFPLDWDRACTEQFPGSRLTWVLGRLMGSAGSGWICLR